MCPGSLPPKCCLSLCAVLGVTMSTTVLIFYGSAFCMRRFLWLHTSSSVEQAHKPAPVAKASGEVKNSTRQRWFVKTSSPYTTSSLKVKGETHYRSLTTSLLNVGEVTSNSTWTTNSISTTTDWNLRQNVATQSTTQKKIGAQLSFAIRTTDKAATTRTTSTTVQTTRQTTSTSSTKQITMKSRRPMIVIMHGERPDGRLQYMYEPFTSTLLAGFKAYQNGKKWDTVHSVLDEYRGLRDDARMRIKNLTKGDIFVFVGNLGLDFFKQTAGELKNKGTYVVHYETEPHLRDCHPPHMDELWYFTKILIDKCPANRFPKLRYVPPGALITPRIIHQSWPGKLTFMGTLEHNNRRKYCWDHLRQSLPKSQMVMEYGAWTLDTFAALLNRSSIFLNLHKHCGDASNPVTVRNAKLLNAHALIISERCYSGDETEFSGMIDFLALDDIPKRYAELVNMSQRERQQLASARAAKFAEKFDPVAVFDRAGIYHLLDAKSRSWGQA
eukprot:gnl/MRDRNA2_/MRDRNA2_68732_c0_seq1.p1 gnl/MRDRNA2_/MRDRNA2_68732_c0~~gnl/MRDRNA2_/MRDRNA2_68732_c0_seq1.p1  ORF type:complete len:498 (+),score=46.29 gnl/MRDRNA2_/MRDRNA2_68732_c0_seq1:228-1721(+)